MKFSDPELASKLPWSD